jgi:hypothetical protein
MADVLPGIWQNPSRPMLAAKHRTYYSIRNPGGDTSIGSEPYVRSLVNADSNLPIYAYAQTIANGTTWQNATGPALRKWLQSYGTDYLPAVGAVGFVQITASAGGVQLQTGDTCTVGTIRYRVIAGGLYQNLAQVAIAGIDTGPQTNQAAGTTVTWASPRPGCGKTATVVQQQNGAGLTGGAPAEDDAHAKLRLSYLVSHPPAAGNEAHYISIIATTPGLAVQQAFVFPGCMGPGTMGIAFTLRPAQSGANRIPSTAQLTLALGYLQGVVPATDGIFLITLIPSAVAPVLKVAWAVGAPAWEDPNPFPLYQSPGNNWGVTTVVQPTASTFNIKSLTDATVPQVGQSIALFDVVNQVFRQKKILTATATAPGYTITVDPTNGSSDLTYAPFNGQLVCPWSDSLDTLVAPMLAYFDSIGPGEQFASFFDEGLRQKRSPPSPQTWSSQISNRMLGGPPNASLPPDPNAAPTPTLFSTTSLEDVLVIEPAIPYSTPVGSPGVSSYLLELSSLVAFPE